MITPANQNPNLKVDEPADSPFGFKNVPAVDIPIALQIQGQIPSWVNGVGIRLDLPLNIIVSRCPTETNNFITIVFPSQWQLCRN